MKFGIFYEHQLPRPWDEESELRLFQESLDQVELADQLGIDAVWAVEHHFLEEYAHGSAPEIFLVQAHSVRRTSASAMESCLCHLATTTHSGLLSGSRHWI